MGTILSGKRWTIFIPIASIMYLLAFVDRTNLSFVLPYMGSDIHLTNSSKGTASGVFFIGYLLLQVPAALLAERWSATKTVFILMVLWGIAAIATGFARTPYELYTIRFLLGVCEGGIQPATLVLMLSWFPQKEKARASGFWLLCIPLSAIIAAPITGFLLEYFSWRTVLILEGAPPILWAFFWLFMISDTPEKSWWMSKQEQELIRNQREIDAKENARNTVADSTRYRDILLNRKVVTLVGAWFLYCAGFYGFTMWLPQVIANISQASEKAVGVLTAIPYIIGLLGMIFISVRSDKKGLDKTIILVPLGISALALIIGQLFSTATLQFVFLCLVAGGLYIHGAFFALPPLVLNARILPLALGLIGGIGNLGGFVGPYVVGWLIDLTGSPFLGFFVMAACLFSSAIGLALITPKTSKRQVSFEVPETMKSGRGEVL